MRWRVLVGSTILGGITALGPSAALAQERVLMRHGALVARAPEAWCAAAATIHVDAPDAAAFGGDRVELQRLLAGLRAILPLECPAVRSIRLVGRAGGRQVAVFRTGVETGWALRAEGESATVAAPTAAALPAAPAPSATPGRDLGRDRAAVREAQERLAQLGFLKGRPDGAMGPGTRAAIEAFQRDRGLPVDPRVTEGLLAALREHPPRPGPRITVLPSEGSSFASPAAGPVIQPGSGAPPRQASGGGALAALGARLAAPAPRTRLPNEPDACDLLAADPWDPQRVVAEGVEYEELAPALAVEACRRASRQLALPRFAFQEARALMAAGRRQEAEEILSELEKRGYAPASFALAWRQLGPPERWHDIRDFEFWMRELLRSRDRRAWGYQTATALSTAVGRLERAAGGGYPPALHMLALLHRRYGTVVEAARLARTAAEAGHRDAAFLLGELYEQGEGVPADIRDALRWYRVAAENGRADAVEQVARYDPNGAVALRERVERYKQERASRSASARERALAMLEEERPRIVLDQRWPQDVLAAVEELRWTVAEAMVAAVDATATSREGLEVAPARREFLALPEFWWTLAGADYAEPGEKTSPDGSLGGLRLARAIADIYPEEEDRRDAYRLQLWGLGELASPVPPPAWAAEASGAPGAVTIAELLERRLERLSRRLATVQGGGTALAERVSGEVEAFRALLVRSIREPVRAALAGEREEAPILGASLAWATIREMLATVPPEAPVRIATDLREGRIDGTRTVWITQLLSLGPGGAARRLEMAVPIAIGSPLPTLFSASFSAEEALAATARAHPAILALELGALRWAVERLAAAVERSAGVAEKESFEPRPGVTTVVATRAGGAAEAFAASPGTGIGAFARPTEPNAAGPSTGQPGSRVAPAAGGSSPIRFRLQLADGSTIVAELASAELRFRSLFGEQSLPIDKVQRLDGGVLSLVDGTSLKGELAGGRLVVRTQLGELLIEATQIRSLERTAG